ncbi:MAG: hypothetical protein CVU15_02370 [Betaproteobacteria bacterium HGW-Betaproteobacteria-1]|jgi:hypothetical protein|nr:MAG: hypothetical protein CVU15_02370 [Betaproteobacteria bacterium HGW-Betaproteobacteria-1]
MPIKKTSSNKPIHALPIFGIWLVWFASGLIYLKSHGLPPIALIENTSRLVTGLWATWLVIDIALLAYAIKLFYSKFTPD